MDYDLALHNTRVLNDGGSVPNPIQAESYIKYLKENNLWDSCVFFGMGGSKIDSNGYCSKLYDLKGNADLLQVTGTAQPKYQTDGSLLFDGSGDYMSSISSVIGNRTSFTASFAIKTTESRSTATYWQQPTIFGGSSGGGNSKDFALITYLGRIGMWSGIGVESTIISTKYINDNIKHFVQLTYDNSKFIIYVDGVEACRLNSTGSFNPAIPCYVMAMYLYTTGLPAQHHQGELSNLMFHNKVLNDTESTIIQNIVMG